MSKRKKEIRRLFREGVWARDGHRCVICSLHQDEVEVLDAHHITDRNEMPNGGYVVANGISLCPDCHLKAESYHISGGESVEEGFHPDELYELVGSSYERAYRDSLKL